MFKLYTLNIANNKSCYTKNAYKIFFIILELIRNYQLSSLLIILFRRLRNATARINSGFFLC